MIRTTPKGMLTVVSLLVVWGCTKPAPDHSADPAPADTTPAAKGPTPATSGGAPHAPLGAATPTDEPAAASADESRPTDIGTYTSVVPNPSMTSKLPCPPGTTQSTGDHVLECRSAGAVGKTLSKRHGPAIWFHKNGKVHRAGSYDQHEWTGRWWELDDAGRPTSSSAYKNGMEDGLHVTFHPNGKRASETFYKEGKMSGLSKVWTEEGELMGTTTYADGKVVGTKTFKYKLKVATPEELKKLNEDLQKLLDEQKKEMDKLK
ncbi:MAG: hypothetical protein IPF92_01665 [Myxococcales bacterium]|nr:hypothetical protein [Myxococcales bacterium]MBL0193838.1 hypothetical protein [Myxococcales bacterium]